MATTQSGLSYVGAANAPSAADTDNTENIGALVEMGKGKGMNVSGKIPLGAADTAGMLANMQKIIDERSGPMNTFLSGLQRASAWGSGGANGPAAALTAMDRERSLQDQETLTMQQNMAAMKAQQAARQRFANSVGFGGSGAQAQPGGQAFTQDGAQAPAQPGGGVQIPDWRSTIMSLPKNMRGPALNALQNGDENSWNSILAATEKNRTPESRNLEQIQNMAEGPDKQMLLGQTFEKGIAPRSYVQADGKTYQYSPEAGMPPSRAPAAAPGRPNITDAEAWARSKGIPISPNGGNRTFMGQVDQYIQDPSKAAFPGTSPHQEKRALDIPLKYRNDPKIKAELLANGFRNTRADEPWHYELVGDAPVSAAPTRAAAGTSKEDVALQQKGLETSSQSFHANDYKAITERANIAKDVEKLSDQVLANIEGNNFGPGTKLGQSFMEYAQLAGVKLNPKETQKYVDNMGIETARKFLSAAGARQAMGAQFTAQEAGEWLKAFAGIDNTKQYLKNFYQVQRAGALVDQDVKNYLLRNKGREQEAYIEWQDSGAKDRIMRENVDAFKNGKLGKVEVSPAKPGAQKPVKRTGMVTDKNNPNYGKQVIQYNDGTLEYK